MTANENTAGEHPGGDDAAQPAARPRRKRRVRVIEVLDDEDLDEVLNAIEAEEAREAEEAAGKADEEQAEKPAAKLAAKPGNTTKPRPPKQAPLVQKDTDKAEPGDAEDDTEDTEDTAKSRKLARKAAAASSAAVDEPPARSTFLGLGRDQAVVVVLLVAVLATLAIWQWRSASAKASNQDERDEVAKVASAYGDAALTYNASNYQAQMEKAQKLMGGDLLESFKTSTLPNLGNTFKSNPDVALTSSTNQVFVGSVDDRFATAVISVDVTIRNKQESTEQPATLLRLALAKLDGEWKVTKQYASGVNDQNQNQNGGGTLGNVPSGSPSSSPSTSPTDKDSKSGNDN